MSYPLHITDIPYATHTRLNTLDIWLPRPLAESPKDAVWIIYIHGGAWRDPLITASSIRPTIQHLQTHHPALLPRIAAIASLHYRLSPYPSHPTHPTTLRTDSIEAALEGRSVAHPTHRDDVLAALRWLKTSCGVGVEREFVMLGHSCGATLAVQVLPLLAAEGEGAMRPRAVAGVAGIYDIPRFAGNHADAPVYAEILAGAFGGTGGHVDEAMREEWDEASPVRVARVGKLAGVRKLLLAQSRADGLVEWEQVELMRDAVQETEGAGVVETLEIGGQHDECWETGEGLARVVGRVLEGL
ncbi:Alpha/Beta hydrolase protein [Phyllosticta citriasiana]|uniref:Kynurenine formamidase n=1 Tax=Phyllosticta citriasiana TaxID=595635 RepID=A0ABR1KGA9_9PEZI